jgi:hypothetical protein
MGGFEWLPIYIPDRTRSKEVIFKELKKEICVDKEKRIKQVCFFGQHRERKISENP